MAGKQPEHIELGDLFSLAVDELDASLNKPNILNYVPYPEQQEFHESAAFGRYVAGGNRGGKTDSVVVEAIWWATDTHPYQERPAHWGTDPITQRFVVVDVEKGVERIIIPKLRRWCAKSMLVDGDFGKSWDSSRLLFTFANGSTIDFLTHGMTLDKHGGVPRHIVYFDEEPPQPVFNENAMRLLDYEGRWVIAATPVKGMGWTYDLLWERAQAQGGDWAPEELTTHTLSAELNPYLLAEAEVRSRYYIGMSSEEQRIREKGEFVARSGLVFAQFDQQTHVIPAEQIGIPPKNWEWYSSVDFGINNPTAWLWHAVSPTGQIITFAEHYQANWNVGQHATAVMSREAAWGHSPEIRVGDPHGDQRQGNTGTSYIAEYANRGIYIGIEGVPRGPGSVMMGIEKMQQYFALRPNSPWGAGKPTWLISSNCVNFIRELRKLRWATYESENRAYTLNRKEEVHKKDDHAFDSARYFATLMPDLTPIVEVAVEKPATTISYQDMLVRLAADEDVELVDTQVEWQTTESYETFLEGAY